MAYNQRIAYEAALTMLRDIDRAAAAGDEYARILQAGYASGSPAVLGMRWPKDGDLSATSYFWNHIELGDPKQCQPMPPRDGGLG